LNRVSKLVILLFLITLLSSVPVSAQTDQGFEWGFAYDDEFHFMMHLDGDNIQIDEEIYIELHDPLPVIPDSMDNWTDIPWQTVYVFYANGTELGIEVLAFVAMYNVYLPIGNWELLSTLAQNTHEVENFTLDTEDPFFWGYSWEDDNWERSDDGATIYSNYTLQVHVAYLKLDGYLTHYSVDSYNTTTLEKTGEITLERLDIEQYSDTTAPSIDHPFDIEYPIGQFGNNITWHATDDYPSSYEILLDGTLNRSGLWNSTGEAITIVIDGLSLGEYNYTLVVYDIRGNSDSDEVMVTVHTQIVTIVDGFLNPWLYAIILTGVATIAIVIVLFLRRR